MTSHQTCLLCLQTNENLINFYSESGKELNMINILSTHFWFQLDEIKVLSQNICSECWKHTESFHGFYQSIREAHKKLETVPVKMETEISIVDYGETYVPVQEPPLQSVQMAHNNSIASNDQIEDNQHDDEDESSNTSVYEIANPNSNDTETKDFVPEFALAAAKSAESELVPAKSKHKYQKTYANFMKWKMDGKIQTNTENVLLAYFKELSEKFKPTTVWSYYSMLKCQLKLLDNVDISKFFKLTGYLRNKSVGHKPVQAEIFTDQHLFRFIFGASDSEWLDVKVVCIFGITGTLRTDEITKIKTTDIERHGKLLLVHILEAKTKVMRSFTIPEVFSVIVQRYADLRSPQTIDPRFFMNYRAGKCTIQPIGKNKVSKMPERIAIFLQIPAPERFTGHTFRRTSASLLANAGAGMERIMRAGGWKNPKVIETYVENSI